MLKRCLKHRLTLKTCECPSDFLATYSSINLDDCENLQKEISTLESL